MTCAPAPDPADSSAAVAGLHAWTTLMEEGVKAWTAGFTGCAETLLQIADAQARAMGQLTGLGMAGWQAMAAASPMGDRLREPLLFAEEQVERMADGVRQTLADLDKLDEGETPVPLPE
jgi:hypothetical protein